MFIDDYDSTIQQDMMLDDVLNEYSPIEDGCVLRGDSGETAGGVGSRLNGDDVSSFEGTYGDGGDETTGGYGSTQDSTAVYSEKYGENGDETSGGYGQEQESVDFSKYKVDATTEDTKTYNPTFDGHSQSEINNHISKAKLDISSAESDIRHHEYIARIKARMGEPHSLEDYQISQAQRRLAEARQELYKWQHMKPDK